MGITSFPTFLNKIVSGIKLPTFLRDFKAGMQYVIHTGKLINNADCVDEGYALDARMGKTLNDNKLDKLSVYNGLDKSTSGYALDARQGKVLNEGLSSLNDEITALSTLTSRSQTYSFGGTDNLTLYFFRIGSLVYVTGDCQITDKTSVTGADDIGSIPAGFRPRAVCYAPIVMRNIGTWANATYYHAALVANGSDMIIRGNGTELKNCQYCNITAFWLAAS